ncbi:MAG: OsmC family protein [Tenericutes bacterium]|nr:OsmC family protein [Mycoplasmatota bacterium]
MLTTFKAKATKLANGMQVETKSRNFTFLIDEPKSLGGTDIAMSPVEVLLGALGGCQAIVAAAFAKAHDITFEEFHTEIEGDIDLAGFMGKADVRVGFQEIRYTMHFKTNEPREKMEEFVAFIERTCPVGDSLQNGVKLVNAGLVLE